MRVERKPLPETAPARKVVGVIYRYSDRDYFPFDDGSMRRRFPKVRGQAARKALKRVLVRQRGRRAAV